MLNTVSVVLPSLVHADPLVQTQQLRKLVLYLRVLVVALEVRVLMNLQVTLLAEVGLAVLAVLSRLA